jgi:hypothetical protein
VCIPCPFGKYGIDESGGYEEGGKEAFDTMMKCFDCDQGKYQGTAGSTSCLACPVNTYALHPGRPTCDDCPVGKFQHESGQAFCKGFVQVGAGPAKTCGATTAFNATPWQSFGWTNGVYMDIDASFCKFHFPKAGHAQGMHLDPKKGWVRGAGAATSASATSDVASGPQYLLSLLSTRKHWRFDASVGIAHDNGAGLLRVVAMHKFMVGAALLQHAKEQWRLSWLGVTGPHVGMTIGGKTGWQSKELRDYDKDGHTLYADIDTSGCSYKQKPRFFAVLWGVSRGYDLHGLHMIYYPRRSGFRVYITSNKKVTAAEAETMKWAVGWVGMEPEAQSFNIDPGQAQGAATSGNSGNNPALWASLKGMGMAMDVNTMASGFTATPTYIASIVTDHSHWRVSGASAIYSATTKGFRLYLPVGEAAYANKYDFDVNYVGYDGPVDCTLSQWAPPTWSTCSASCGGGEQNQTRFVAQPDANGGLPCAMLRFKHRKCGTKACAPVDCKVSYWTMWSHCTMLCSDPDAPPPTDGKSSGGMQNRGREMIRAPQFKGSSCPKLKETRLCNTAPCPPVDCQISPFTGWTACTKSCGGGVQTRSRLVLIPARYRGKPCPSTNSTGGLNETRVCSTPLCPVDCVISGWGRWGQCPRVYDANTGACRVQYVSRHRRIIVASSSGGRACPPSANMTDSKVCAVDEPCSGMGNLNDKLCGQITGAASRRLGDTKASRLGEGPPIVWQQWGSKGVYAVVSTDACHFSRTPQYAFTVLGIERNSFFGSMLGLGAISNVNKNSFTVILSDPHLAGAQMQRVAQLSAWRISWLGQPGSDSGITVAGSTQWHKLKEGAIQHNSTAVASARDEILYTDVHTLVSGFEAAPRYFPTLLGKRYHHQAYGLLGVYPTYLDDSGAGGTSSEQEMIFGFRVYVGCAEARGVSAEQVSKEWEWHVAWVGDSSLNSGSDEGGSVHGEPGKWLTAKAKAGAAGGAAADGSSTIFLDVDTSPANFQATPTYVASLMIRSPHPQLLFASTIDLPTKSGLEIYVRAAATKAIANGAGGGDGAWSVSYLGWGVVDCVISKWSQWHSCSVHCGSGSQYRTRRVAQQPVGGGVPCPLGIRYRATRSCNTVQCVGDGPLMTCGGVTAAGSISDQDPTGFGTDWFASLASSNGGGSKGVWKPYGHSGVYVEVDTSMCKFKQTPYYFLSVVGDHSFADDWELLGTNAVVRASKDTFTAIIVHNSISNKRLLKYARRYMWRISWVGATGKPCGMTAGGKSGWKQDSSTSSYTIFADVDTTLNGYSDTKLYPSAPRYFTALHGPSSSSSSSSPQSAPTSVSSAGGQSQPHWATRGVHIVYMPSRKNFRVYVVGRSYITPAQAEQWGWRVAWLGDSDDDRSGQSMEDAWRQDPSGEGMRMDVDTRDSHYPSSPAYLSSVSAFGGVGKMWEVTGAAAIFSPTRAGFRVYLHLHAKGAEKAKHALKRLRKDQWRVNYLGVAYKGRLIGLVGESSESNHCPTSTWSAWTSCLCHHAPSASSASSAGNYGLTTRSRDLVLQQMRNDVSMSDAADSKAQRAFEKRRRECEEPNGGGPELHQSKTCRCSTPAPTPRPPAAVDATLQIEDARSGEGTIRMGPTDKLRFRQAVAKVVGGGASAEQVLVRRSAVGNIALPGEPYRMGVVLSYRLLAPSLRGASAAAKVMGASGYTTKLAGAMRSTGFFVRGEQLVQDSGSVHTGALSALDAEDGGDGGSSGSASTVAGLIAAGAGRGGAGGAIVGHSSVEMVLFALVVVSVLTAGVWAVATMTGTGVEAEEGGGGYRRGESRYTSQRRGGRRPGGGGQARYVAMSPTGITSGAAGAQGGPGYGSVVVAGSIADDGDDEGDSGDYGVVVSSGAAAAPEGVVEYEI